MVSISRDQWLKYGALLLIVVFVGETIFLGLSSGNSAKSASPTPTSVPLSFSGQANVSATVVQLGDLGLVVCPSSLQMDVRLKNESGVSNALYASADILAIQFKQNASLSAIESLVFESCGAPLFRSAIVDLPNGEFSLTTENGTQAVSGRQLAAYFSGQGLSGFQAFISPSLKATDAVNVSVSVVVKDNQFVSVAGQQPQNEVIAAFFANFQNQLPNVVPQNVSQTENTLTNGSISSVSVSPTAEAFTNGSKLGVSNGSSNASSLNVSNRTAS
ncbi:hypothetical protein HY994_05150 [Candidatus Micrarchaeota archaeon]|nr:hypothetical protein [Candidatus Micrarchaeota archaeon]